MAHCGALSSLRGVLGLWSPALSLRTAFGHSMARRRSRKLSRRWRPWDRRSEELSDSERTIRVGACATVAQCEGPSKLLAKLPSRRVRICFARVEAPRLVSFSLEICLSSAGHGTDDEEEEEEEEEGRNPVCLDLSFPCTSCVDEVKGNSCSSGSGVLLPWWLCRSTKTPTSSTPEILPCTRLFGGPPVARAYEESVQQTPDSKKG